MLNTRILFLVLCLAPFVSRAEVTIGAGSRDGLALLGELKCVACHHPGPAKQFLTEKKAPVLAELRQRTVPNWVHKFIAHPTAVQPGTPMPDMMAGFSDAERGEAAVALARYLQSISKKPEADIPVTPDMVAAGEHLFNTIGCFACHGGELNASLEGMETKTTVGRLARFLQDPLHARPGGRMPDLQLNESEALNLAAYVLRKQKMSKQDERLPGVNYTGYMGPWEGYPDLDQAQPVSAGNTSQFHLEKVTTPFGPLNTKKSPVLFGVRMEAFFHADQDGDYEFRFRCRDKGQCWIDGTLVADLRKKGGNKEVTVSLQQGAVAVRAESINTGDRSELLLEWRMKGEQKWRKLEKKQVRREAWAMEPPIPAPYIEGSKEQIAHGKALFTSLRCAACHDTQFSEQPARPASTLPGHLRIDVTKVKGFAAQGNSSPGSEGPKQAFDGNIQTKYLNFGKAGSGLEFQADQPIITALGLVSANDHEERDPTEITLEGSSDGKSYIEIYTGKLAAFSGRQSEQVIPFENNQPYHHFRLTFTGVANAAVAVAVQIAEINLYEKSSERFYTDGTKVARPMKELKASQGCLADEAVKGLPRFGLSERQRQSLRDALEYVQAGNQLKGEGLVKHHLTALNCVQCHARDKDDRINDNEQFNALALIDMGDEGRLPPNLHLAGGKFTPAALLDIMHHGARNRPHLAVRMPAFGDGLGEILFQALAETDIQPTELPPFRSTGRLIDQGRKLVGIEGLGCINCHSWDEYDSLGIPGVNLSTVGQRLTRDWFHRWMKNPPGLRPNTRMPMFWTKGKSGFTDLYDGDMEKQLDAIWAYLSAGKSGRAPSGMGGNQASKLLVPEEKPIVFRTFMNEVSAHAVLVGFPQGRHVVFDANRVRMIKTWQGDFIGTKETWDGRAGQYAKLHVNDQILFPDGPAFAPLPEPGAPWPSDIPKEAKGNTRTPEGWKYKGYRLAKDGVPTFRYFVGDMEVLETPSVSASGVVQRSFRISQPVKGIHLRIAVGETIESNGDTFIVNGFAKYTVSGTTPLLRESPTGGQELLVPVTAAFNIALEW